MRQDNIITIAPKDIPTDIIRDFPGRFHVYKRELRRLVEDIDLILHIEKPGQQKIINFWVRLENGTWYHTDDIEIVLKDDNENSKLNRTRIMLIIIFADLVNENAGVITRIVVQFSRANVKNLGTYSWEYVDDETFNLNFHGVNYRVKGTNRQSAMSIIEKLESRLRKFRRKIYFIPSHFGTTRKFLTQGLYFIVYGLLCLLSAIYIEHFRSPIPITISQNTRDLLAASSFALITIGLFFLIVIGLYIVLMWFLPPTFIEIGEESEEYHTNMKIKGFILVPVILAILTGIISGVLTNFLMSLFKPIGLGGGR